MIEKIEKIEKKEETKILVLVNSFGYINSFVYANHINLFTYTKEKRPDLKLFLMNPHRMNIDRAQNYGAVQAMALGCDYYFVLDDDILIPKNGLIRMIEADRDIVGANVVIRGLPFHNMAFDFGNRNGKGEAYIDELPEDEVFDCDAVGFSCTLVNTEILKALEPPYFVTGPNFTEDIYFCDKCRTTLDPRPTVAIHTGVKCGHMMHPEPIEPDTKQLFTDLYQGIKDLKEEKYPAPTNTAGDHIQRIVSQI